MTAKEIVDLRQNLGIGVQEFAEKIGVSRMTVFRWEQGQATPSGLAQQALERLAKQAVKKRR